MARPVIDKKGAAMGMCLGLCTVSEENLIKVLADPPLIWKVLAPDDPEPYEYERKKRSPGFFARLFSAKHAAAAPAHALIISEDERHDTDLDKAWHGIHYLLTQSAWAGSEPLNFLACGGHAVGDIDVGYGPARAFSVEQVKAIYAALCSIDERLLRTRFNPSEMMALEIYPAIWDRDPAEEDTFAYCIEYFEILRSFIAFAANNRLAVIIYMS